MSITTTPKTTTTVRTDIHNHGYNKLLPLWVGLLTALVSMDIAVRLTRSTAGFTAHAERTPIYIHQKQEQDSTNHSNYISHPNPTTKSLPTCKQLMQEDNSPYQDGEFLTRHTQPVTWIPRADGSRQLEHSLCRLHRYTAEEARQCLAGKHLNFIGDSLTRYQFTSLAALLHKGSYPPHWERPVPPQAGVCLHIDEHGRRTCSPPNEPNLCHYHDWEQEAPPGGGFLQYDRIVGSIGFDGYLEANAIRTNAMPMDTWTTNYMYVTPPKKEQTKQTVLTYLQEIGWNPNPYPIQGFHWRNCAFTGTCDYPEALVQERIQRAFNKSFDFSQDLPVALEHILPQTLPPVDIALYNRGVWGDLNRSRAERLMPLLKKYSAKCFYQTTTGTSHPIPQAFENTWNSELDYVRSLSNAAGCGFIDLAHLMADFNEMPHNTRERAFVFIDNVHFRPWVYEEINNLLLNQLCNGVK